MKNWLATILKFLPAVLTAVKAVEDTVDAPGLTKRSIVVGLVTAGAAAAEKFPDSIVGEIGALTDVVVGLFNSSGVFTHKSTAVPAK